MISCTSHVILHDHKTSVYAPCLTRLKKTSRYTSRSTCKGKVHPVTGHEVSEVEYRYSSTLSFFNLGTIWVCVCVGFVMCECFDNCVGVLVIRVLVFTVFSIACTVFLYFFVCVYLFLFVTSVRTTATE